MCQHLVHRVFIEQPSVQCFGLNVTWNIPFLVPFDRIPAFLLFFAQVFVVDAFTLEFQRNRDRLGRNEELISYRLIEIVDIGWDTIFEVEKRVP